MHALIKKAFADSRIHSIVRHTSKHLGFLTNISESELIGLSELKCQTGKVPALSVFLFKK